MNKIFLKLSNWKLIPINLILALPGISYEDVIISLISKKTESLEPEAALRFLFHIDQEVYQLESAKAVQYGGGIHPKHRLMNYHDFFVKRLQASDRVVDIGCGNGALSYDIAQLAGSEVLGIDINAKNIQYAKKHYEHPKIKFVQGDALCDLPNDEFDVIVLSNVLEHLANRTEFLKKVCKSIKPSRLLIRVPLFERDWRIPLRKELKVEWRLDPTHETEYTIESFEKEMEEAGLNIKHIEVHWGEIWSELSPVN
ncbi:MAG: class I SAM-dependent methyltransferase [Anaerolineaceae bacterium]|nr:class I SAM-dependent methyltransferase [Anaerolineaceae bacterium]